MPVTPYIRLHIKSRNGRSFTAQDITNSILLELKAGHITNGHRLPPVRVLAHQLGISKNTVQASYEELISQGRIISEPRKGYKIAVEESLTSPQNYQVAPPVNLTPSPFEDDPERNPNEINLSMVFIDPELIPKKKLSDCMRSVLSQPGLPTFHDVKGYLPLREIISKRLEARGIHVHPDHLLMTTGSQQGLDIVCRAMKDKIIATEDPAYSIGKHLFHLNQMDTIGLRINPFYGVDFDQWESALQSSKVSLLYLTSSFQNPTGYSYSTQDLMKILRLSQEHKFGILEDDWGSDMLSFSEFRPPLKALGGENVIYMNSFTKKLLPSLRIGYLAANPEAIASLTASKRTSILGNPIFLEIALFEFLDRGYFDTHLRRIHEELDRRYCHCLAVLNRVMPKPIRWSTPGGGPILWLEIPKSIELSELQSELRKQSVFIDVKTDAFFGDTHLHGFRIGFAFLNQENLEKGLLTLGNQIRRML